MKRKIFSIPPNYLYESMLFSVLTYFIFKKFNLIYYPFNLIGILVFVFGFLIMMLAWGQFKKAKTPEDFSKSTKLIADGLFKYSRNPMYIGMLLMAVGLSVFVQNIIGLFGPLFLFLVFH